MTKKIIISQERRYYSEPGILEEWSNTVATDVATGKQITDHIPDYIWDDVGNLRMPKLFKRYVKDYIYDYDNKKEAKFLSGRVLPDGNLEFVVKYI